MGHSTKKLDLTGQRYGKLTVLRPAENIGRKTAWVCRCDCGRETVVRTSHLRTGKTRTCGCQRTRGEQELSFMGTSFEEKRSLRKRLDLTGQRFGKLNVLRPAENIGKLTTWVCRCDCGQETVARTDQLRSGFIRACDRESGACMAMLQRETARKNNTSGVPGVEWVSRDRRWKATICVKRRRYYLGAYNNFEDAVRARKQAEETLHDSILREFAGTKTRDTVEGE